jgi:hypothetical protein
VVVIHRKRWSPSTGNPGRHGPARATARYVAADISTQLMLKVIVEILSTMTSDPDGYRSALKKKPLELAVAVPLAPMPATQEAKFRGLMRESLETY